MLNLVPLQLPCDRAHSHHNFPLLEQEPLVEEHDQSPQRDYCKSIQLFVRHGRLNFGFSPSHSSNQEKPADSKQSNLLQYRTSIKNVQPKQLSNLQGKPTVTLYTITGHGENELFDKQIMQQPPITGRWAFYTGNIASATKPSAHPLQRRNPSNGCKTANASFCFSIYSTNKQQIIQKGSAATKPTAPLLQHRTPPTECKTADASLISLYSTNEQQMT